MTTGSSPTPIRNRNTPPHTVFWVSVALLLGGFIYLISPILLPFLMGIGIAYMLDPLADKLELRGCSRTLATTIVSGSFFIILILAVVALIPLLINQISELLRDLPTYMDTLRQMIEPYVSRISEELSIKPDAIQKKEALGKLVSNIGGNTKSLLTNIISAIFASGMAVINFISVLVLTPVVSFYLLRDWDKLVHEVDDLLPRRYEPVIKEQLLNIDTTISAFLRGQLNVILILATFYAIALSMVGLSYSILIGLLAGILVIIPYIGAMIGGALSVGIAYFQFDSLTPVAIVGGIFIAGQMAEGYVLTPKLVGGSVGLNPLWIIFGMMAGGTIMGFVGILLAVPLTAICGVLIRFAVSQYRSSAVYHDNRKPRSAS